MSTKHEPIVSTPQPLSPSASGNAIAGGGLGGRTEEYVAETVTVMDDTIGKIWINSVVPFAGFFIRYLRDAVGNQTIAKIRLSKQGAGQRGQWATVGEGFGVTFSGHQYADVIEIAKQKDGNQPKLTVAGNVTACIVYVSAGSQNTGQGY